VSLTVPISLESLLLDSAIDAELGALASMLVDARVPVIVAGDIDPSIRARVLVAFLGALPADVRRIELAGPTEDFAWLPEAEALGWRSDGPTPGRPAIEPATAEGTVILAGDLAPDELGATWAGVVRIAVRAVSLGYGLGATVAAPSLEAVLARLRAAPMRLAEDELSRLGLVLIVEPPGDGSEPLPRVVAAHYLRPVARDMHGHVQKLGPAVLATWDERAGRFEHFGWGVTPELAMRTGRHAGDFEIELERRREALERGAT
jgi:hypothetical protein